MSEFASAENTCVHAYFVSRSLAAPRAKTMDSFALANRITVWASFKRATVMYTKLIPQSTASAFHYFFAGPTTSNSRGSPDDDIFPINVSHFGILKP
jgi:hypothetical protein